MTGSPFTANGRRARILRATRAAPLTLSEIIRRVRPSRPASARDDSLQRLKTSASLKALKSARLMARTRDGWIATAEGQRVLNQLDGHG